MMAAKLQENNKLFFSELQPEGLFVNAGTLIFLRNDTDD